MTNGVAIFVKVTNGEAKSKLQCQNANASEISLALAHLEMTKLKLMEGFIKLSQKD